MAAEGTILDLRNPPENLPILNIVGAMAASRLCIWARNGDVTGDGIDDLAIGADQEQTNGDKHAGAVYLVRGGEWLLTAADIDLADFGTVAPGNIARIKPRAITGDDNTDEYHFGATLQLADLDGNNKAEVIAAAALNRSGAAQKSSWRHCTWFRRHGQRDPVRCLGRQFHRELDSRPRFCH